MILYQCNYDFLRLHWRLIHSPCHFSSHIDHVHQIKKLHNEIQKLGKYKEINKDSIISVLLPDTTNSHAVGSRIFFQKEEEREEGGSQQKEGKKQT